MALRKSVRRASAIVVIATASVLPHMSPALAAGAGVTTAGYSNINQVGQPQAPLCLPVTSTYIKLYNSGTFNNGPALDFTAEFNSSVKYWFGPHGTFKDSQCTMPTGTTFITGSLTVKTSSGTTLCTVTNATYDRVGTNYVIKTPSGTCGNPLVFTGVQNPCFPAGPSVCEPDGPTSREFVGEYTQV